MVTVKLKSVHCVNLMDGSYKIDDIRYNLACKPIKIIKFCLKHGFSFRVGIRDNILIENKNYIEIIEDSFISVSHVNAEKIEKRELLTQFLCKNIK